MKKALSLFLFVQLASLFLALPLSAHYWHERVYVEQPWYHHDHVYVDGGAYYPNYYAGYPYYYYAPQYYYAPAVVPAAGLSVNLNVN